MNQIIEMLVPLDSEMSLEKYLDLHSNLTEKEIHSYIVNSIYCLDENCYNLMLSDTGKIAYMRLFCCIENHLRLPYCLMLDKIVIILLWFNNEYDVYRIIYTLIRQDALKTISDYKLHLILSKKRANEIIANLTKKLLEKGGIKSLVELSVNDMLTNMLFGYISPLYYPFILINFIIDGYEAILKMIYSLFNMINYQDMTNINQIKEQLNIKFNYAYFIRFYTSLELNWDLASFNK